MVGLCLDQEGLYARYFEQVVIVLVEIQNVSKILCQLGHFRWKIHSKLTVLDFIPQDKETFSAALNLALQLNSAQQLGFRWFDIPYAT